MRAVKKKMRMALAIEVPRAMVCMLVRSGVMCVVWESIEDFLSKGK